MQEASSEADLASILKAGETDWDVFSLARKGRSPEEVRSASNPDVSLVVWSRRLVAC